MPGSRELNDVDVIGVHAIDLLVHKPITVSCDWFVGRDCGLIFLGGRLNEALTSKFRLVRQRSFGNFTVARFEAPGIVRLTKSQLAMPEFGQSLVLVLPSGP